MADEPTIGTVAMGDTEATPKEKLCVVDGPWHGQEAIGWPAVKKACEVFAEKMGYVPFSQFMVDSQQRWLTGMKPAIAAALSTRPAQEPVAWLRVARMTPITGEEYSSLWLTNEEDERAFPVYRDAPCDPAAPQPVLSQPEVKSLAPVDVYKVLKRASDNGRLSLDFISQLSRDIAALCPLSDIPAQAGEAKSIRVQAIEDVLSALTAHELYQYRPKAFEGFIQYARETLASEGSTDASA